MNEIPHEAQPRWKRNATLFIGGQALSMFGSMLVQYAVVWHVTLKTQSGTMMTLFNTPAMTILQTKVDAAYMGRVFSVMTMIQSVMMPAAMILFEPLADVININWLFISTGAVLFALGFVILSSKVLREAGGVT